jgi:glutaconate CoA-transferase, subunit B
MATTAKPTAAYTRSELMVVAAARALRNEDCVFVGIGLPNVACNLAKRLHAPRLQMVYESGIYGANPERQPLSIGDPGLVSGAISVSPLSEIFLFYLQRGLIDVGFLGGAQVDQYGNLNTTVIGDYESPVVRLPGSGGASDIAALARRVFIIGRQSTKTFVERVDFVTSPGNDPKRTCSRLQGRGGPELVVTDLGVYDFGERSNMRIRSLHPGVTPTEVRENTGWQIEISPETTTTAPPNSEELRILRDELDPHRLFLGKSS